MYRFSLSNDPCGGGGGERSTALSVSFRTLQAPSDVAQLHKTAMLCIHETCQVLVRNVVLVGFMSTADVLLLLII